MSNFLLNTCKRYLMHISATLLCKFLIVKLCLKLILKKIIYGRFTSIGQ